MPFTVFTEIRTQVMGHLSCYGMIFFKVAKVVINPELRALYFWNFCNQKNNGNRIFFKNAL